MEKEYLNGVGVYPFTSSSQIVDFVNENKVILVAINTEKILHATDKTRDIINRNLGYCDGVGAQKAMQQRGHEDVVKIPGCELWLEIIDKYSKTKSFYLLGGKQDVVQETVDKLNAQYPEINIVGYHDGYLTTKEIKQSVMDEIVSLKPDVVFVAMGSPLQEFLMDELYTMHQAVYQGLGGSFDVFTGHVKRAPKWWIDHKMEFAYRLVKEPKRIKRQIHWVKYAWWLWTGKFKKK